MSERIDDVTIVGGGDSGLLAALALDRMNSTIDVAVVDDFSRDIPQVGKSTYLEIGQILHDAIGIDQQRFISEVRPVWKASVYFRDWCDNPPFHYPFDPGTKFPGTYAADAVQEYYYFYDELYRSDDHRTICEEIVEQRKSPFDFNPQTGRYDRYDKTAYHLNTDRFNSFLRTICRERGISLLDDEIIDVEAEGNHIDRVRSKSQSYEADLFVDATGFNRVLKGELDSEFVDFPLPMDSAFNTRVDHSLADVVPATVVETGDYGWFWQIDTYDNRDLGYVFASEYVSDESARAEFVEHCGGDVSADDVVKYEFTSGYYAPAWEGNCVAIGNAEGFVEPLQSTGLTANAAAAVKLSTLLSNHGRIDDAAIRESYNTYVHESWESINDFISVHYRHASGDNEFWRDMQSIDVSPRVELLSRQYDENGIDRTVDPTKKDPKVSRLEVFEPMSFYLIMRNMGVESAFYEENDFSVDDTIKDQKDRIGRSVKDHVEDYLTVQEMYATVVDQ